MVGESEKWEYGKWENGEKWEKGKKEEARPRGKVSRRGEIAITKDKRNKFKELGKSRNEICLNQKKKNNSIL